MKTSVLIFSGYNYRGIIAFCRFCVENKIAFFIVASSADDKIMLSRYKMNVIHIRQSDELNIEAFLQLDKIIRKVVKSKKIIILPSTEFLNRFLLRNRKEIEGKKYIIPLCQSELYNKISDKFSFSELCKSYKIKVPNEYCDVENAKLPFVIKPKKYFDTKNLVSKKPKIIKTNDDLNKLNEELNNSAYYYQEYIAGKSFYLLYYINSTGAYSVFSQENLIQQNNGMSIIAAVSSDIHNLEISKKFADFLISEGFFGLIMIEVKLNNNQFYMIEANPRLWGPSQLIIDSGMDLFHIFAIENGLLDSATPKKYYKGINYLWSGGIIYDQKNSKDVAFHNYSEEQFFDNYYKWINCDILNRSDTKQIYYSELR